MATTPTSAPLKQALPDSWLGGLFLRLLPGCLYFAPSFVMPLVTVCAAVGAVYGPALLAAAATLPLVRDAPLAVGLLTALGTQQPWCGVARLGLSLLSVWYAFVMMPLLDAALGSDFRNPAGGGERERAGPGDRLYRGILYAYVPVHLFTLGAACHLANQTNSGTAAALPPAALFGVAVSCGVANGILFTVAHELLHGARRLDRLLAGALLAAVGCQHWTRSHLMHHIKVATPEDPSSARLGEGLWSFIPRSVLGNLRDGYGAEAARRARRGIPALSPRNRALWWVACPSALAAAAACLYGWRGLAFVVAQASIGVAMLEVVNYIEHYGLARAPRPGGGYERVGPRHSWNASHIYTNSAAFKLQRHSDHHAAASTPYHRLRDLPEAPQLPTSYPGMMLLATWPPLFRRVMDPRVRREAAKGMPATAAAAAGGARQ